MIEPTNSVIELMWSQQILSFERSEAIIDSRLPLALKIVAALALPFFEKKSKLAQVLHADRLTVLALTLALFAQ